MTTFLTYKQPTVDRISAHSYKRERGGTIAVVDFHHGFRCEASFHIDDVKVARQLLAAAFEAVRILDPDGAADALIGLIEGDALAKIRARILEDEARCDADWGSATAAQRCTLPAGHAGPHLDEGGYGWPACLSVIQCTKRPGHDGDHVAGGTDVTWPQAAAPDTAQPEDIPGPSEAELHHARNCGACPDTPAHRALTNATAPVETGAPWRSSAEAEWDGSR